ncbi:hypothetical protein K503DRAFT_688010, partial [Rhizopogon vinicolor AM-OR11-026]
LYPANMSSMTLRILSFWVVLFAISTMGEHILSIPVQCHLEPDFADKVAASPIDSQIASLISSNLNLNCIHGCPAANSSQQLNTNSAFTSASSPNSFLLGAIFLAGGVLVAS